MSNDPLSEDLQRYAQWRDLSDFNFDDLDDDPDEDPRNCGSCGVHASIEELSWACDGGNCKLCSACQDECVDSLWNDDPYEQEDPCTEDFMKKISD